MPCSQMISMNCSPPRPIAASSPAALPAANARLRNRSRWNIGSALRRSTTQKATSVSTPPTTPASTHGLVQPVDCPPYGWIPYVIPASNADRPTAKVRLPGQSSDPRRRTVADYPSELYEQALTPSQVG